MIILIAGTSHTGKTLLAQKLLEKYNYPYISIDHIKMGLIRSGYLDLSPNNSEEVLTNAIWPVIREIIKTNIENGQNLIIEGCYIPFDFKKDFDESYLKKIKYICLIFSEEYLKNHFSDIIKFENVVEKRLNNESEWLKANLAKDNYHNLYQCTANNLDYILIDKKYEIDFSM